MSTDESYVSSGMIITGDATNELVACAERYMLAVKRLGEESGYNRLTFFEAPILKMPTDDMRREAHDRWLELNNAGQALTAATEAAKLTSASSLLPGHDGDRTVTESVQSCSADTEHPQILFLREAANYFRNRPTHGEDRAFWSNVANADNCEKAANLIERMLTDASAALALSRPVVPVEPAMDLERQALEQIKTVCVDNAAPSCKHRMALDFVRQIASDALRDTIAKSLFEKTMAGHAQWDEMAEPNKDDWRVKADAWIAADLKEKRAHNRKHPALASEER